MQHDDEKTMMKMMYRGISISRYFKTHYSSVSGHDTAPLPDYDTGGLAACIHVCGLKQGDSLKPAWRKPDTKQLSTFVRLYVTGAVSFSFYNDSVCYSRALGLAVLTAAQWTNLTISRTRWTVICRRTRLASIDLLTKTRRQRQRDITAPHHYSTAERRDWCRPAHRLRAVELSRWLCHKMNVIMITRPHKNIVIVIMYEGTSPPWSWKKDI